MSYKKPKLNLSLDKNVAENAKKMGLCIPTCLQVKLCEYFAQSEEWACCDLNASLWLPKPQGYQATPQARDDFYKAKRKNR